MSKKINIISKCIKLLIINMLTFILVYIGYYFIEDIILFKSDENILHHTQKIELLLEKAIKQNLPYQKVIKKIGNLQVVSSEYIKNQDRHYSLFQYNGNKSHKYQDYILFCHNNDILYSYVVLQFFNEENLWIVYDQEDNLSKKIEMMKQSDMNWDQLSYQESL